MLDENRTANARRIAGHTAAYTAGALRRAADVSATAASTLADSLDVLSTTLEPTSSRKREQWLGGVLAIVIVVGFVAFIMRRRARQATPEAATPDLEAVPDQRTA